MTTEVAAPDCLETDRACRWLWELTDQVWLAEGSTLAAVPLRIALILAGALAVRWLLRRGVNRLVRRAADGTVPIVLRPLPPSLRRSVQEAAGVAALTRRKQRAATIGSVLRGAVSITVFAVAGLLILSELDIHLGPLLAGAGIAGVALGFGAQSLVKDVLAGLFILLEDQYNVGDVVDLGEASGVVEAVGLRITTLKDLSGVSWYVPNGEIRRVGNRSQGAATVVVDMPIGFAPVNEAVGALRRGADKLAEDPAVQDDLAEPPELLGVHEVTVEGAVVRTTVRTQADAQWRIARELRRRQTEALHEAGLTDQILAARRHWRRSGGPEDQP